MLERNRLLVERDLQTNDQGTLIRVYEHKKTGETFLIPDPKLRLDQLEVVQQEVITLLGGPLRKGEPAAAPSCDVAPAACGIQNTSPRRRNPAFPLRAENDQMILKLRRFVPAKE
jgi:hypothetical protein